MKKWIIMLFVVCVLFSGCGNKGQGKIEKQQGELASYQMTTFPLPSCALDARPIAIGKHVYYMTEPEEGQYTIQKLDLTTGETEGRALDFVDCYFVSDFTVDEVEEYCYYLIQVYAGEADGNGKRPRETYLIKETMDGEQIYKKIYTEMNRPDIGVLNKMEAHGSEVSMIYPYGKIILDEDGEIASVEGSGLITTYSEYQSYEGYMWRRENGELKEKLFDLTEFDFEPEHILDVFRCDDDVFVGVGYTAYHYEIYLFTPAEESVQKQSTADIRLVLGVLEMDPSVRAAVVAFNKSQTEINISIKEYGGNGKSAEDAYSALNADIAAGSAPDIIALGPGEDHRTLTEHGVLENLQGYVDKSKKIHEEDYIPAALETGRYDGLLYGIPTEFTIQTLAAKSSVVGKQSGITIPEVRSLHEKNPQMALLKEESKLNVISMCLSFQAAEFIDEESRTADFDKETFYELLEFADTFSAEAVQDDREALLYDCYLYNVDSLLQVYRDLGTDEVTFIGYPTADKSPGYYVNQSGYLYGICSQSTHKDECWAFVEAYLETQAQNTPMFFSARRDVLEKQFVQMLPEQKEDGLGPGKLLSVLEAICEQPSQAQSWEEEAAEILMEELQAYFAGQRDAKRTAEVIQNRIQNYMKE